MNALNESISSQGVLKKKFDDSPTPRVNNNFMPNSFGNASIESFQIENQIQEILLIFLNIVIFSDVIHSFKTRNFLFNSINNKFVENTDFSKCSYQIHR